MVLKQPSPLDVAHQYKVIILPDLTALEGDFQIAGPGRTMRKA